MNVSLLVPCYNAAGFLPALTASARAQTLPFAEIIAYDDGSSDETASVARELGWRVISPNLNRGAAHARNQLWRAASCDWVHFHDADDLLAPDYVAKTTARISPDIDVVICNAEWRDALTREVETVWRYVEAELLAAPVSYLLTHPVGGINGLYRRTSLAAINGYDERLRIWEDADLHLRLAARGARFAVVEESLVIALRHRNSLSSPLRENWRNRLTALGGYATTLPPDSRPALLLEIEQAAHALLHWDDTDSVREAIRLARSLGGDPPTSNRLLITLVKRLLGPVAAFKLQARARGLSKPTSTSTRKINSPLHARSSSSSATNSATPPSSCTGT